MSRYIDADDAIYRLEKLSYGDSQPKAIRRAGKYLNAFANECPADVEKVRHGHWSHIRKVVLDEIGTCSVCGERRDVDRYCSNCGAKMDKEKEE